MLLLAWGVLAFGAEYAWAYAALLVFALAVSLLGFRTARPAPFPSRTLLAAFLAFGLLALLQAAPLPKAVIAGEIRSKAVADFRQLYAMTTMQTAGVDVETGTTDAQTMSIAPKRTLLGLTFFTVFVTLLWACARAFGRHGVAVVAAGIVVLGVAGALASIIQPASRSEAVYGFWYAPKGTRDSAPFINHDHTAGWLVMVLALSGGYLGSTIARLRHVKPTWRDRLLWLSSADASRTVLTILAAAVMALAIMLTKSRSGFLCLAWTVFALMWVTARRQSSASRRVSVVLTLAAVVLFAFSWGNVNAVLHRFDEPGADVGGRIPIWRDAMHIVRDFPIAGTGLNTFGIAMLHYQTMPGDELFIEAHNDYLQLLAEGGVLLAVPAMVCLVVFVTEVRRRFREAADDEQTYWLRIGAVIGLCGIALQECFDFTLQMPGAAVLFVVLAAIAIHRPVHVPRESRLPLPA